MRNFISLIVGLFIGALIMYFVCNKNTEEGAIEIIKPNGVISPREAEILDENFNARHQLISAEIVMRPDNRSSWWSLQDIQDYIVYAQNQSKELGYTMDGIRVYLGAYPDTKAGDSTTVGYTTMFIVPTSSDITARGGTATKPKNADIPGVNPINQGTGGYPPSANYPQ